MKQKVMEEFGKMFGAKGDIRTYFAPGRVNLIGEHTDYNGGHVFPCALTIGTYGAVRKRDDRRLRFYSMNFPGMIESSLDELVFEKEAGWTNYPKGVIWAFEQKGCVPDTGLDLLVYGDIPGGSGLSSSASLEVLVGLMLRELYGFSGLSMVDIALLGQYAENHFNGMNCGIMDQFASAMGKKDCAIFLDTSDLSYEYAKISLQDAKIVITNSKVKHTLVDSAYNDRRNECEKALAELQEVMQVKSFGELSVEEFENKKYAIHSELRRRRAKHAVYENQRTIRAVEALKKNDVEAFGRMMNESHISLRDDYEVSCEETDILAEAAWNIEGVMGSRITGGGFGGCTVSIVSESAVPYFKEQVGQIYHEKTGNTCEFYVVDIGDGARQI